MNLKIVTLLFLCISINLKGQTSCSNAGFEFGNWDGFEIFTGSYSDSVITYSSVIEPEQHQIMLINEGFDPIAEEYCLINNELSVVGGGLGNYSLRLGNAPGGSFAAKIAFELDVTQEVSFLILNYAVILEDPDHPTSEQPTFQMNIKDENGEIFDCGHYEVTAGLDLDGFENCGDWRV